MSLYKEISRKEAVEQYGSESCKAHFQKYNKFKNKNLEIALIKTMEQYYEKVEKEGKGDKTIYKLYNKKIHPSARADKRLTNGRWSEIGKILPIQILCSLFEEDKNVLNNKKSNTKTYIQWTSYFGLINSIEYSLYEHEYQPEKMNIIINLLSNKDILAYEERTLINDMIGLISKKRNLVAKSLQRLEKIGVIECIPMYKAFTKQEEKSEIIDLSKKEFDRLQKFRKTLLESYEISEWRAMTYINSPKAREFRKEWKEYLENFKEDEGLKIQNIYIQYEIVLVDASVSLEKCVEKYCSLYGIHADANIVISKTKERMPLLIKNFRKDYYKRIYHHYSDEIESTLKIDKSIYEIAKVMEENPIDMVINAMPKAQQNRIHLYRNKDYMKLIVNVEKYLTEYFSKVNKNNK